MGEFEYHNPFPLGPDKTAYRHVTSDGVEVTEFEGNEILRFLEMGIDTYAVDLIGDNWAVDEKKDLRVVEKILSKKKYKKLS